MPGLAGERIFTVAGTSLRVRGENRPLLAGMGGRADIIVGRRSLLSYAFEPIRMLRETLADRPASR